MIFDDADFASSLRPLEESSDEKRCSTHGSADYPTIPRVPIARRTNVGATSSKRDKDLSDLTESWSCSWGCQGNSVQTHKSDRQEAVWVCSRQWAERKAEGKLGLLQVWSHWRLWWWTLQALRSIQNITKPYNALSGIDESIRARQTVFDGVRMCSHFRVQSTLHVVWVCYCMTLLVVTAWPSCEEKIVPKQAVTLPMGLPREAVSRCLYDIGCIESSWSSFLPAASKAIFTITWVACVCPGV